MNVSAIHAMPKRAIIATIPERKIDMPGMSAALTLQKTRISAAAVSITIWMIGVTASGSVAAVLRGDRRPDALEEAEDADHQHGAEEDRDAALRVRLQLDLARRAPAA